MNEYSNMENGAGGNKVSGAQGRFVQTEAAPVNAMAVAALIFGILAIPTAFALFGVCFSGLAMTFALLSRGGQKMSGIAAAGFCCAVVSLLPFLIGFAALMAYAAYQGVAVPYDLLDLGLLPFLLGTVQELLQGAALTIVP